MSGAFGEFLGYTGSDGGICWGVGMGVLLADDQAEVRSVLRLLFEQSPGPGVVGAVLAGLHCLTNL